MCHGHWGDEELLFVASQQAMHYQERRQQLQRQAADRLNRTRQQPTCCKKQDVRQHLDHDVSG